MTKEEAKAKLEDVAKNLLWGCGEYSEALDMAIKVLELEPCSNCITFKRYAKQIGFEIEQEPCDDCVSRQAAIEAVKQAIYNHDSAIMRLTELPPVTPQEPKTGHWIFMKVSSGRDSWKCSVCGRRARGKLKNLPYCHCGAKMESEGE